MSARTEIAAYPLLCRPILVPKPWGGRTLERVFGRALPAGQAIGETWEVSPLSQAMSVVENGPLAGSRLADALGGRQRSAPGREGEWAFPWLIKFLDARDNLSIQVHPKPRPPGQPQPADLKHEAWYVLYADAGAQIFAGLRDGVSERDVAAANGSRALVGLLNAIPVAAGDCVYLPSGMIHALGAGILVAEVQTPSDTTYRMYDWDRVDGSGKPREMHLEQGLANTRFDVRAADLRPRPARAAAGWSAACEPLVRCDAFQMDRIELRGTTEFVPISNRPEALIVLTGGMRIQFAHGGAVEVAAGRTVVSPAGISPMRCSPLDDWAMALRVTVP
ncbi:MAG: type I phosphomannose isomerase catalytic subunit [Phycisphaerae bacterium]|nr:type I phosphomannose isomerase catalytic subunit [Phycisphaerae bacterium]